MSQHRFTADGQNWTVGYDGTQATYFAQVEPVDPPDPGRRRAGAAAGAAPLDQADELDEEDPLRTVVGDDYGQVRSPAELRAVLADQVRIPDHVLSALEQEGPARVGPAELAAASANAHRWLGPDTEAGTDHVAQALTSQAEAARRVAGLGFPTAASPAHRSQRGPAATVSTDPTSHHRREQQPRPGDDRTPDR